MTGSVAHPLNSHLSSHLSDFVVVIPARLGASRLPNKPLVDIAGQPMILRVAQRAACSVAQQIIVAYDDQQIADALADYPQSERTTYLQTRHDHASGTLRLVEVCDKQQWADHQIVVNVQGDEPLMTPELINTVAQSLADQPDCVMATLSHAIEDEAQLLNPNCVKVVCNQQQQALYFSRAPIPYPRDVGYADQPAPEVWQKHIGIYAYRAGFLRRYAQLAVSPLEQIESLEQLRVLWHGEKIAVRSVHLATPLQGVDTPDDLQRVRQLWCELT
jgi:3-deoxy-manno-octulosonate cytidylyltransferase (CMP-KDO synthetase)